MNKKNNYNFTVYAEGLGFLISYDGELTKSKNKKTPLFAESVNEALTFRKKDAQKIALELCEFFKSVWVMKKSGENQSSKFLI